MVATSIKVETVVDINPMRITSNIHHGSINSNKTTKVVVEVAITKVATIKEATTSVRIRIMITVNKVNRTNKDTVIKIRIVDIEVAELVYKVDGLNVALIRIKEEEMTITTNNEAIPTTIEAGVANEIESHFLKIFVYEIFIKAFYLTKPQDFPFYMSSVLYKYDSS